MNSPLPSQPLVGRAVPARRGDDVSPLNDSGRLGQPSLPQPLAKKIKTIRRKQTLVAAVTGLIGALGVTIMLLLVAMVLDWSMDFPWITRLLVLLVVLEAIGYVVWRFVVRPILWPPTDEDVALWMEREEPQLRGRMIASVQLGGTVSSLVRVTEVQTATLVEPIKFTKHVRTAAFWALTGTVLLVAASTTAVFVVIRPASTDLLKRACLMRVPVPRKTHVECVTGNCVVARGEKVTLEAIAHGIVPPTGIAKLKYTSGRTQTVMLDAGKEEHSRFTRVLDNVQESFKYTIKLNDGLSESCLVDVQARPTTAAIQCEQHFPDYTHLPPASRRVGDLALLVGSRLQLNIKATKPIKQATVRLVGLNQESPVTINPKDATQLTTTFPIPATNLTGFVVELVDTQNLKSKDEVTYRIDLVPDRPPSVIITYPERREELLTTTAKLLLGFEATDDYGLGRILLHSKIDAIDNGAEKTVELDLNGETPRTLRRRHEWNLSTFTPPLPENATIEWWLEVRDTNDITGPGVTVTEHHVARIVGEIEKRADLMRRLDESLSNLTGLAQDQETLNKSLGDLILQKRSEP